MLGDSGMRGCLQVDMTDYSEITTFRMDGRCVLDLTADSNDEDVALVTMEGTSSSVRIYDVGRERTEVGLKI